MKKPGFFLLLFLVTFSRTFAQGNGNNNQYQITLSVTDSATSAPGIAFVNFSPGDNPNFNSQDIRLTFDSAYALPQIYSLTADGVPCWTNNCGNYTHTYIIPLGITSTGGTYLIAQAGNNFPAASMIILEDRLLGAFTDLKIQPNYSVSISQQGKIDGRFFLLISYPPQITPLVAGCTNQNGTIQVAEDTAITWTYCDLYDSTFKLVGIDSNVTGNFSFTGLNSGVYTLLFNYNDDLVETPLFLGGSEINIIELSASHIYAAVYETINFYSEATNTPDSGYNWSFGDSQGGVITGIDNPTYSYPSVGIYNVTLTCYNDSGCTATSGLIMHIDTNLTAIGDINGNKVQISNINKDVRISITNALQGNYNYEIAGLTGKTLFKGPVTSTNFIVATDNLTTGIYVVTVSNTEGRLSKKIFIP